MKDQINFRASELTTRQLAELSELWGTSQTETLTVAIDRAYQAETKRRMEMLLKDILSGAIQPEPSRTDGETFFFENETMPLVSLGRVPGKNGMHILRRPDGSLTIHGGYYLRRQGEHWDDYVSKGPSVYPS